jgi:hypothetical protein
MFFFSLVLVVKANIYGPGLVSSESGSSDIDLKWNSTNGTRMLAFIFKVQNITVFAVNANNKPLYYNTQFSKENIRFIGNLKIGRAWVKIVMVTTNMTVTADIREDNYPYPISHDAFVHVFPGESVLNSKFYLKMLYVYMRIFTQCV